MGILDVEPLIGIQKRLDETNEQLEKLIELVQELINIQKQDNRRERR